MTGFNNARTTFSCEVMNTNYSVIVSAVAVVGVAAAPIRFHETATIIDIRVPVKTRNFGH